jgi:dUTP pyrophosphatase
MIEVEFVMAEGCEDLTPSRAHPGDAGFDLRSREEVILAPGERRLIKTGLFLGLPAYFEAQVRPRSGLAYKHGITVVNAPGTIDEGYRGEVGVILLNTDLKEPFAIKRGERIAQMIIQKLPEVILKPVQQLTETVRGEGGFGSSGVH